MIKMPQRHKGAKDLRDSIINDLSFVKLCAFAPWWQNKKNSNLVSSFGFKDNGFKIF
jgi:hypothetical protein